MFQVIETYQTTLKKNKKGEQGITKSPANKKMKYEIYIVYKNNNSIKEIVNDLFIHENKISYCAISNFILSSGRVTLPFDNIRYIKITPIKEG